MSQVWVMQWFHQGQWKNWTAPSANYQDHMDTMLRAIRYSKTHQHTTIKPYVHALDYELRLYCIDTGEEIPSALFE